MDNPNHKIHQVLNQNKESIAQKVVEMQFSLSPEYMERFGDEGKTKSIRDAEYHIPFLSEAILLEDKEIFTDYIEWVKILFKELNLEDEILAETLNLYTGVLKDYLSEEQVETVTGYIQEGISKLHEPTSHIESYIDTSNNLGKLAKTFNETLLEGRKNKAAELIFEELKKGTSIKDIYLQVFQVSQLEVGRLWLMNKISVAKEHYVSAATQMIMSQLYPYIFSTERKGRTFIGACVGGELHEIGIRMVCDFFEMEGWDTYYLGANTPATNIISSIKEYQADIIGLSIAMPYNQSLIKDIVSKIKKESERPETKVIIGGNGINQSKDKVKTFGADGYAPDAHKAVELANQLI
jgi:methanogenic corrinoid protein MtbC1